MLLISINPQVQESLKWKKWHLCKCDCPAGGFCTSVRGRKAHGETGSIDAILLTYKKKHKVLCYYLYGRNWTWTTFLAFRTKPCFTCSFSTVFRACPGCVSSFLAFLMPTGVSPLSPPIFHLYWKQYLAKPLSAYYFIPKWICLWFLSCKAIGGTATACALGFQGAPRWALDCGYRSYQIR